MLDSAGKEIIPLKYDSLDFMNEGDLEDGKDTTLYLKAKYEDKYFVFDESGKQILDKDVAYESYSLGNHTETSYTFCYNDTLNYTLTFYNKKGDVCSEINYNHFEDVRNYYYQEQLKVSVYAISENNYYVYSEYSTLDEAYQRKTYSKVHLYDKAGNLIKQWDFLEAAYIPYGVVDNTYVFSAGTVKTIQDCPVYELDKQGNIQESSDCHWVGAGLTKNGENVNIANSDIPEKAENIKISHVNNTWKLDDSNGNPIYEDRYLDCYETYNCHFFIGEKDKIYVVTDCEQIIVDDETFKWSGNAVFFKDTKITDETCFCSFDGVCFIAKNGNKNEVYFYNGK